MSIYIYWVPKLHPPACETDNPANSISWSIEKAPMLMRSLSSAMAFLAESVYAYIGEPPLYAFLYICIYIYVP